MASLDNRFQLFSQISALGLDFVYYLPFHQKYYAQGRERVTRVFFSKLAKPKSMHSLSLSCTDEPGMAEMPASRIHLVLLRRLLATTSVVASISDFAILAD
jgi:hypothetical protein